MLIGPITLLDTPTLVMQRRIQDASRVLINVFPPHIISIIFLRTHETKNTDQAKNSHVMQSKHDLHLPDLVCVFPVT